MNFAYYVPPTRKIRTLKDVFPMATLSETLNGLEAVASISWYSNSKGKYALIALNYGAGNCKYVEATNTIEMVEVIL